MLLDADSVSLDTPSHFQINRPKLRMVGTFLVPIAATLFLFVFFKFLLPWWGLSFVEYEKIVKNLGVFKWGIFSIAPWGVFISLLERVIVLAIAFTVLYKNEKILPKDVGLVWSLGKEGWKHAFRLNVKILFLLVLFFITGANFFYHAFSPESLKYVTNYLYSIYEGTVQIDIFSSAFEEILFRGIYCTLFIRYGFKWNYTILITGVFFGLIHLVNHQSNIGGYIIQVGFATVVGWFLGWMFYRTRTLVFPIIWHYAINIFIYFGALRPDLLAKIADHLII